MYIIQYYMFQRDATDNNVQYCLFYLDKLVLLDRVRVTDHQVDGGNGQLALEHITLFGVLEGGVSIVVLGRALHVQLKVNVLVVASVLDGDVMMVVVTFLVQLVHGLVVSAVLRQRQAWKKRSQLKNTVHHSESFTEDYNNV